MKELFLAVTAQLKTVNTLRWIDDDSGQMDDYNLRPDIAFPAALVSLSYPNITDTNEYPDLKQLVEAQTTIRLVFEVKGETNSSAPLATREAALERYDIAEAVHVAMQGFDNNGKMHPMSRISQISEVRKDGYKVIRLVYQNAFLEVI